MHGVDLLLGYYPAHHRPPRGVPSAHVLVGARGNSKTPTSNKPLTKRGSCLHCGQAAVRCELVSPCVHLQIVPGRGRTTTSEFPQSGKRPRLSWQTGQQPRHLCDITRFSSMRVRVADKSPGVDKCSCQKCHTRAGAMCPSGG